MRPLPIHRRTRRARHYCLGLRLGMVVALLAVMPMRAKCDSGQITEILADFGFSDKQIASIRDGRVVVDDGPTILGNELNVKGAVMLLVPLNDAVAWLKSEDSLRIDVTLRAAGRIRPGAVEDDLSAAVFTATEQAEVDRLLAVRPGIEFNLSSSEIARVRESGGELAEDEKASGGPGPDEKVERASTLYRRILRDRTETYLRGGLDGIADYDRGGGRVSSAARDLRIQTDRLGQSLGPPFTPAISALSEFPRGQTPDIDNLFFWRKGAIDDRPIFILLHRVIAATPQYAVFVNREFFAGHSYSALQEIGMLVADGERTLVVLDNMTLTDQVTGFFGPVARRVAQARLRSIIEAIFAKLPSQHQR